MHATAVGIEALPIGGIRVRAARRELVRIADGHPDNAFINVTLRIARGRPVDVRQAAGEELFATLKEFVDEIYQRRPLALSFEIQEIDPDMRWKQGNIRDFMAARN
jgi:5-carboxymethyl-2-hydroxymuconate isomerase